MVIKKCFAREKGYESCNGDSEQQPDYKSHKTNFFFLKTPLPHTLNRMHSSHAILYIFTKEILQTVPSLGGLLCTVRGKKKKKYIQANNLLGNPY